MTDNVDPDTTQAPAPAKKRRRVLRWVIPIASVVIVAGVVGGVLISHRASAEPAATTVTREVQASMVTMTDSVTATGTISPKQRADLSFTSSGTVTAVNVAVGDTVTAGQALATIDSTNLQAAVDSAQAAVDAAQSDYDTAVSGGVDARITAAKSTLATKQDSLTNAQSALAAATLTAPFDGTVAVVSMAVGDTVGSSGGTGGGGGSALSGSSSSSSVITVITTDMYSVSTSVGASDVTSISKGQDVQVTPNGASTQLRGTVTSVGVIASSTSASGASFPVTIDITDPQQGLYAGVSASVTIITSSRQVLAVPTAAITMGQGGAMVELKTGEDTTTTNVTVGASSNSMTEITSGLNEGDTVIVTTQTGGNATSNPNGLSSFLPGTGGRGGRPSGDATAFPGGGGGGGFPGGGASGAPGGGGFGGGGFGGGAGGGTGAGAGGTGANGGTTGGR